MNNIEEIKSPALRLSRQGLCLAQNALFSAHGDLLPHKQQIIDHVQPYLTLNHKTTSYYTPSCRVSLSIIAIGDDFLLCCNCTPRPKTTLPAKTSIQHDCNYFALLDSDLVIVSSNHPQLTINIDAQSQFSRLFSPTNINKIQHSLSQLTKDQRVELVITHEEQAIFLCIESILLQQPFWLVVWHPMSSGSKDSQGIMQKYRYLLNAVNQLSEGMVIVDKHHRIELCNQQFYRIFPYLDKHNLIGMNASALIDNILAVEFNSDSRKIKAIKHWYDKKLASNGLINFSFTSASGLTLEYRDRFTADNERICLLLDETSITQLHEKMEKTWLKSVEISTAKSQFMATMGHEIRTPLNAVIGLLELTLRDSRFQDNKHLQVASRSANHLLHLLNDVLDYTKFEADKVNLSTVDADLRLLCEDVMSTFAVQAQQRGIWLELFVDPKLEKLLHYDDVRITQILHNLLSNAIKFNTSETPSVLLKLEAMSSTATSQTIKFSVCDNGIGLTPEQQDKIFQGFVQADDNTYRKFGGTGLGLSICQKICHLMQSELKVDSEVKHGATFYFIVKIPFTNSQKNQISQQNPLKALSRADLNIYTNHPKLSYTLQRYGEVLGFKLHYASSYGLLELADPEAVMLFDPHQPDLKFCKNLIKNKDVFQHLLTMPQRKALLVQDGDLSLNQTSIKQVSLMPLRLEQLLHLVNNNRSDKVIPSAVPEQHTDSLNKINALVVEDNADNIFVLEHQLASIGVRADFCDDPEKAIIKFQQHNYNLILSDYQMPHLSGAELTQTIRYIEETEFRIPAQIIVLTADKSPECQTACNKSGVNQIIIKPLSLPLLRKYLCDLNLFLSENEEHLEQSDGLDELKHDYNDRDDLFIDTFNDEEDENENENEEQHNVQETASTQVLPLVEHDSVTPPMDINVIYKFVGEITDEEINDFLKQFYDNLALRHQGLLQAFMEHDFASVHTAVHTIKSSALYIGAEALSLSCQQLENITAGAHLDLVEIHRVWQTVNHEIERLLAHLVARRHAHGQE